jgi:hypothetical protein
VQGGCLVDAAVQDVIELQWAGRLGPGAVLLLDDEKVRLLGVLQLILHPWWQCPVMHAAVHTSPLFPDASCFDGQGMQECSRQLDVASLGLGQLIVA